MTLLCSRASRLSSFRFVTNFLGHWGGSLIALYKGVPWIKVGASSYRGRHPSYVFMFVTLKWYSTLFMRLCGLALFWAGTAWADRICAHSPPELSQLEKEGIQIDHYYLSSSTSEELIEELRTNGPRNEAGRRFNAFFSWYIAWKWPVHKQNGQTVADYFKLSFERTLRLQFPCWQPSQRPRTEEALKQWNIFVQKLARHEMKHYHIFREGERKLIRALTELTSRKVFIAPETVNAEGHKILEEIRAADAEYDAGTDHGRTEGVTYAVLTF